MKVTFIHKEHSDTSVVSRNVLHKNVSARKNMAPMIKRRFYGPHILGSELKSSI